MDFVGFSVSERAHVYVCAIIYVSHKFIRLTYSLKEVSSQRHSTFCALVPIIKCSSVWQTKTINFSNLNDSRYHFFSWINVTTTG